jgi:Yip1-like protein
MDPQSSDPQGQPGSQGTAAYTPFNAMMDIIAAPGQAMDGVRGHNSWLWWPLLTTIILSIAVSVFYVFWVDFPWLIEETIRALPADSPPETEQAVRDFMSPDKQAMFSVIGITLITFVIYAVQALYLNLVTKMSVGDQFKYGDWFSFSAWTAFVGVFNIIIMFGVILSANTNQLAQQDLVPLSFNSLFIHAEPGDPWFTWANSLTLVNIWTLVLMSIGYNRWTQASMAKSTVITWAPWVALFGVWALTVSG